jgi:hypothetical protein
LSPVCVPFIGLSDNIAYPAGSFGRDAVGGATTVVPCTVTVAVSRSVPPLCARITL